MSDECCENVRAESLMRIYHYLDGELTTTEIREISVHLEQCPSCHDEYEIEALLKELVRNLFLFCYARALRPTADFNGRFHG